MAVIVVSGGETKGEAFEIRQDVTRIGRAVTNDFVINNSSVSGEHCSLRRSATGFEIEDHGSTNGTYVNGVKVTTAPLFRDDVFTLGDIPCMLKGEDVPVPATPDVSSDPSFPPRTTVVVRPPVSAKNKNAVSEGFETKRDFKTLWSFLIGVMLVLVVGMLAYFIYVFALS